VRRLRDYVAALSALYEAFRTGSEPTPSGGAYRISRLQPYFNPGPDDVTAPPPLWIGGVNRGMCELAGEVADGLVTHPTNSDPRYLDAVVRPAVATGAARAGRSAGAVRLVVAATVVTGVGDGDVVEERERSRRLLAFLYSTPAYARTLELHGRDDLPGRLRALVRAGDWEGLPALLGDELMDALVVVGRYDELASVLLDRYGGRADGIALPPLGAAMSDGHVARVVADLRRGLGPGRPAGRR
jgi:probable F420-dependent oxidoreductase